MIYFHLIARHAVYTSGCTVHLELNMQSNNFMLNNPTHSVCSVSVKEEIVHTCVTERRNKKQPQIARTMTPLISYQDQFVSY